ncbi:MAG: ribosomal protein S18-alanine N-acetyltransferase [Syntrophobacterales bacterium]|nr:ribosomal protein S18-alanine N-acetyltransferase [Syntrophobacterales bacterium]
MNTSCAILAGGRSRRMGEDKALLKLGGRPLINHVYEKARRVFDDIIIISNHHHGFAGIDVSALPDVLPVKGSIVGVVSALMYASTPYVFVLACDMPNLSEKALVYMAEEARGEDVIVPRTAHGYEALHAIYSRSCISHFLSAIERDWLKITSVYPYLAVRELTDETVFLQEGRYVFSNINTREDLLAASEFYDGERLAVRKMTQKDLSDILAIEKESFQSPWTERLFEEALLSPIAFNFVITVGNDIVGYLCLYAVEDEAHILNIAVSPLHRQKEYASMLMGIAIEELTGKGIIQYYLEVRESNSKALRLYGKFGFTAIGKRKKYYTDTNEDALVMYRTQGNG